MQGTTYRDDPFVFCLRLKQSTSVRQRASLCVGVCTCARWGAGARLVSHRKQNVNSEILSMCTWISRRFLTMTLGLSVTHAHMVSVLSPFSFSTLKNSFFKNSAVCRCADKSSTSKISSFERHAYN